MSLERSKRKTAARPSEDVILFTVGDSRFAIAANAVDEIRNLDGLRPYKPGYLSKLGKVKYTLVRENKDRAVTYFVVDAGSHFGVHGAAASRVLVLRGTAAAVLVDNIERMAQIGSVAKLPRAFTGAEGGWYRGLATIEGRVIPVVEPSSFLTKGEVAVLQAEESSRAQGGAAKAASVVPA